MPFTNPHQVTRRLNHDMFNDFSSVGMFATVLIGQLDRRNQTLSYCNAGQSPIYYLPVDGDSILLAAQDVPVGILEDYEYSTQTLKMSPGDIFVAASDGFPESCNPAEEMYGYERMAACLLRLRDLPSAEIAARLLADVNDFCDSHPQNDDRTVVVIKMTGLRERNVMPTESMIIRANYNDIRIPCERLRGFLKEAGVPDDLIDQCELPLQELLTNLVDHAYVGDESGRIIVNLSLDGGNLAIETRDTGAPLRLDLARISMPDPAELAEGGYGMAIIQSLMDKVEYSSTQGTNIWKLVKRLK